MHTISSQSPVLRTYHWLWCSYSDTISRCRLFWGIVGAPVALILMSIAFVFDWVGYYLTDPLSTFFRNATAKFVLRLVGRVLPFASYAAVETLIFHLTGSSWGGSLLKGLPITTVVYGIYLLFRRIRRPRVLSVIASGGGQLAFGISRAVGSLWPSVEPTATYVPRQVGGLFGFLWGFLLDLKHRTCTVYRIVY